MEALGDRLCVELHTQTRTLFFSFLSANATMIGGAALLIFGPKRLPELAKSLGKGIREFKRSLTDTQDAIMGNDDQRNLPPRQPEETTQSKPSSGEPKRLLLPRLHADVVQPLRAHRRRSS